MKPILILYATREGQTKTIAERLAARFLYRGLESELLDATAIPAGFRLAKYSGAVLAASVHLGKHAPEIARFAGAHRLELDSMYTALISVSLSQIGAEKADATREDRERHAADVQRMIDEFLAATGWTPDRIFPVAGALMYRKYNFVLRWLMRRIASHEGASVDTSRNVEYTDWARVEAFADDFGTTLRQALDLRPAA